MLNIKPNLKPLKSKYIFYDALSDSDTQNLIQIFFVKYWYCRET